MPFARRKQCFARIFNLSLIHIYFAIHDKGTGNPHVHIMLTLRPLKEYIDVLFDWFKLNSNEFALEIQSVEAAELTRCV